MISVEIRPFCEMASASASALIAAPSVFVNRLESQTNDTLCAQFWDEGNDSTFTVIFYEKNGKLHFKLPFFESELCDRVYSRFLEQLWALGFAVCYFQEEDSSEGKKTVMVKPAPLVAKKLQLSSDRVCKLGFVANKLTDGRVVALEDNNTNTISLLGKEFPFALDLLTAMFPSLGKLSMKGLRKKMVEKTGEFVDDFASFPIAKPTVVSAQPAPWMKTVFPAVATVVPVVSTVFPAVATVVPVVATVVPAVTTVVPAVTTVVPETEDPIVVDVKLLKALQKELKNAEEQRQLAEATLKEKEALEKDLKDRVAALKQKMIELFQ